MRKINKIIILASLLAGGIVTAQEFYTCVPKRDWYIDIVRQVNTERDEMERKRREEEEAKKWELIKEIKLEGITGISFRWPDIKEPVLSFKELVIKNGIKYKFIYLDPVNKRRTKEVSIFEFEGYTGRFNVFLLYGGDMCIIEGRSPTKIIKRFRAVDNTVKLYKYNE